MRRAVWLFVPLVAAAMVAPAPAVAAESSRVPQHYSSHWVGAGAFFRSVSGETEEGWFETYVYPSGRIFDPGASPGAPEATASGELMIDLEWVTPDGDSYQIWVAMCWPLGNTPWDYNLPPGYLAVDASLKSASLHGEYFCEGWGSEPPEAPPGGPYPTQVSVDLTWTVPPGALTADGSTYRYREPGYFANGVSRWVSGPAEVVGTVSDGTTNFTPIPAEFGGIYRNASEEIVLQMG